MTGILESCTIKSLEGCRLKAAYDKKTIDIATEAEKEYKTNNEFKIL
jgi:hypothetical protein